MVEKSTDGVGVAAHYKKIARVRNKTSILGLDDVYNE